ncbi:MAG TPA: D-glycero-beta-D-manno-heptose 1-phosphate adenylyltransferase [Steroidobacteraceae bacterium]|nr:D-glycero-beta-D-manno-heptose 1-phosphate adenylyltransferase [Steroidobacteraceae bacterium]
MRSHTVGAAQLTEWLSLLDRYAGLRLWVVGDAMLDEYVLGAVERISPEAPVPVVRVRETQSRLGGAANVARQAATLGAHVSLGALVGADAAGAELLRQCRACGIDTRAVLQLPERHTTRKLRVLGAHQQLVRLDWEDVRPSDAPLAQQLHEALTHERAVPDALILSDYAKGVLSPELLRALIAGMRGRPVLVDPKSRDFERYRGASVITPNLRELEAALGRTLDVDDVDGIAAAARPLAAALGLQALVVTLGDRGMLIVPPQAPATAIATQQRAVYDVTGAGDIAIAILGLSLAAGAPLALGAHVANAAAGLGVGQIGTVAIDAPSIRNALAVLPEGKILSREELGARASTWRMAGKRVVFTNGCFDLVHSGHLALLRRAAELGDVLVLGINSDASVARLKGPERPLVPQAERAALLAALAFVDAVTIFDEDTPLATLEQLLPQVLVKGADYTPEQVVGRELVEAHGGRVVLVPLVPEKSTSALLERIRRGGAA